MGKDLGLHPIIATALAKKAINMTEKKTPVTGRTQSDVNLAIYQAEKKRKTTLNIVKGVGIVTGGFIIIRVVKKIIKNQTDKDNSPEVQYAKRLRTAMSPSGIWWLPDGTNEKGVMDVAYEIANNPEVTFRDVQTAYKKLYNNNLSDDLEGELNTDEYTSFLNVVNDTYNAGTDRENPTYFSKGKLVVFTQETPMFKNVGDYLSIQTFPKNSFLINAITTGKEKTMVDAVTGGAIWKQKRIELKIVGGLKTVWIDSKGTITEPFSGDSILKYKKKGYRQFVLKK